MKKISMTFTGTISSKHFQLIVAGLLFLGIVIRGMTISTLFVATDQAWHLDIASQDTIREVIANNLKYNVHPPLYYLILHFILEWTSSDIVLRAAAFLPWLCWVRVCYAIGKKIGGVQHGLIWLALATLSPVFVRLSLEIREYTWMLLMLSAQFYYFLFLLERVTPGKLVLYTVLGGIGIGFHYSASIACASMGSILLARAALRREWRDFVCLGVAHALLVALLVAMLSQHEVFQLPNVKWDNTGFFFFQSYALSEFLGFPPYLMIWLSAFITRTFDAMAMVVVLGMPAAVYWGTRATLHRSVNLAVFVIVSAVMLFALDALKVYPFVVDFRHSIWSVFAVMIVFSGCLEFLIVRAGKWRQSCTILLVLVACGINLKTCYDDHANAFPARYVEFKRLLRDVGKDDIVLIDIQTMMIAKYHDSWKHLASHKGFDEGQWEGVRVFYPNWQKLSVVDNVAGELLGGTAMQPTVLNNFASYLRTMPQNEPGRVWTVSVWFRPNSLSECVEHDKSRGEELYNEDFGLILRFAPTDFIDFAKRCYIKSKSKQNNVAVTTNKDAYRED